MSRNWLCILALLVSVSLWSCSDDDKQIVNSHTAYILGDLVNFDSSQPIMTARYSAPYYDQSELYIPNDLSIGEPFLDIDGDGVYTPGVDYFHYWGPEPETETLYFACDSIIDTACVHPRLVSQANPGWERMLIVTLGNQDINLNGVYDGPNAIWTPGVPYEDLDGDGLYDRYFTGYQPGLPFADLNGNGVFDQTMKTHYGVGKYRVENYGPDYQYSRISLTSADSETVYRFVSDSGVAYDFDGWYRGPEASGLKFNLDGAGLWFSMYSYSPLLLLEHGEVKEHRERSVRITDQLSEIRSITFNERLIISPREYTNLVVVDIPRLYETADTTQKIDMQARFYFSPNQLHLLAMRLVPPGEDSIWIYLNRRIDTLPLPMIR